jgi:hypothetical protein
MERVDDEKVLEDDYTLIMILFDNHCYLKDTLGEVVDGRVVCHCRLSVMGGEQILVSAPVVADQLVVDRTVVVPLVVHFEEVEYSRRWVDCIVLKGENVLEILGRTAVAGELVGMGDNFFHLRSWVSCRGARV